MKNKVINKKPFWNPLFSVFISENYFPLLWFYQITSDNCVFNECLSLTWFEHTVQQLECV